MLKIQEINNIQSSYPSVNKSTSRISTPNCNHSSPVNFSKFSSENLKAYIPSFIKKKTNNLPSEAKQYKAVLSKLDEESKLMLEALKEKGILNDNSANDGSTVLNNLYKITANPRIQGLSDTIILKETISSLYNPFSISQKFGDIPNEADNLTEGTIPENARNVQSHSCAAASMEASLAMKKPAEFTRFAESLSGENYSVTRNIKMSDFAEGVAEGLWYLREFNTEYKVNNWENVELTYKPDRNAIVRARVQTSYRDQNERSCIDVLIQSALLNMGSEHTYNSIIDERTGKFNTDNQGLNDFEINFVERTLFDEPKLSVVYQNIDMNGCLVGYNAEREDTKRHILNSLKLGNNVIIGYTEFDDNNKILGGHEITIIDYAEDDNGNGYFLCNDTDDNKDYPIQISAEKLLPLIHHAIISKKALSENDVYVEPWREILDIFKEMQTKNSNQ